jgi:hypothetical protein
MINTNLYTLFSDKINFYFFEVTIGLYVWFGIFLIKNRKESIIYVTFATHWFQSPGRGVE